MSSYRWLLFCGFWPQWILDERLRPESQVSLELRVQFVIHNVVHQLTIFIAFDMIHRNMRARRYFHPGLVPAIPDKEKILRPASRVAVEVGQLESELAHEG